MLNSSEQFILSKLSKPSILKKTLSVLGVITVGCTLLTGCATTSSITPQYIAPSTYQSYDCNSLSKEYTRINRYVTQAQSERSSITTTGIGVGVSAGRWGISPNINIGLGSNSSNQAQDAKLSRLFGERDAVIQSARMKQCPFAAGLKIYGE